MPVLEAIEHLVGLQAQIPLNPYTALWSRVERFRPEDLSALLEQRRVVRIALMRSTIHLVSAEDALFLRPLVQPVLDAELARHREYGPPLRDLDLEPVLSFARALFLERPRTGPELQGSAGRRRSRRRTALRSHMRVATSCRSSRSRRAGSGDERLK